MRNLDKTLLAGFALLTAVALSGVAFADTVYLYVDNTGSLRSQVADTPMQAIAEAENRDPHSGVIPAANMTGDANLAIGGGGFFSDDSTLKEYLYVDIYGSLRSEFAHTPSQAIAQAELRATHSGVIDADYMPEE